MFYNYWNMAIAKKVKWNSTNFYTVVALYVAIIIVSYIYIFVLQGFGSHGLSIGEGGAGGGNFFDIFDVILIAASSASLFLVFVTLVAFKRKKDNRIFILAVAFFFFLQCL